jgi:hypothetical protein
MVESVQSFGVCGLVKYFVLTRSGLGLSGHSRKQVAFGDVGPFWVAGEHDVELVHRAAARGARLLAIENVLADDQPDARGHILDVIMLATTGGKERTEPQLADLFDSAGFQGVTGTPTAGPMRIVETTAA